MAASLGQGAQYHSVTSSRGDFLTWLNVFQIHHHTLEVATAVLMLLRSTAITYLQQVEKCSTCCYVELTQAALQNKNYCLLQSNRALLFFLYKVYLVNNLQTYKKIFKSECVPLYMCISPFPPQLTSKYVGNTGQVC